MASFNKKGMFFTLIALTIVSILMVVASRSATVVQRGDSSALRIQAMDSFLSDVENSYLPLAARASAYKAIASSTLYMNATGQFLSDPGSDLGGVMLNGTLGSASIMANNTLQNFSARIEGFAADVYGIDLQMEVHSGSMAQTSPWRIDVAVNVSYVAKADVGNWTREKRIATSIPVEGFLDPQYLVRTGGAYQHRIAQAGIPATRWNISNLDDFVSSGNYTRFEGSDAPSFLERFKASPAASECCGIESTINPASVSPGNQQESYADYQFWAGSVECANLYDISGGGFSHSFFKLDFSHAFRYNVSAYATALSCTP